MEKLKAVSEHKIPEGVDRHGNPIRTICAS
jgi:hypothetical protein